MSNAGLAPKNNRPIKVAVAVALGVDVFLYFLQALATVAIGHRPAARGGGENAPPGGGDELVFVSRERRADLFGIGRLRHQPGQLPCARQ